MLKGLLTKTTISSTTISCSGLIMILAGIMDKIPMLLLLFIVAVVIDYITGMIKAAFFLHEWNSRTGLQGIIKKIMYFVLIGTSFLVGTAIAEIGNTIGWNLDFAIYIGWYTVSIMLINEYTSILENIYVIMPDKVPVWLVKTLKIANEELDTKINDFVCKKQDCEKCDLKDRCNKRKDTKE